MSLKRSTLARFVFPGFLFIYCLTIGTNVDESYPRLKLSLILGLLPLLPGLVFVRRTRAAFLTLSLIAFFVLIWGLLGLRNIAEGNSENVNRLFPGFAFIVVCAFTLYQSKADLRWLQTSFYVFGGLNVIYSVMHYMVIVHLLSPKVLILGYRRVDILRVSGIYFSPGLLGPFLTIFVNYLLFCCPKTVRVNLTIALSILLLLLTANRSSAVLLVLSLLFYGVYFRQALLARWRKKLVFGLVFGLIALVSLANLPTESYLPALSRATSVLLFTQNKEAEASTGDRLRNNTRNAEVLLESPEYLLLGPGFRERTTDSDMMTFLMHYGLLFTLFYYAMLSSAVFYIGIPQRVENYYDGLRVFLAVTTLEKIIEAIVQGGVLAPGVAGYYFAFLGAALSVSVLKRAEQETV